MTEEPRREVYITGGLALQYTKDTLATRVVILTQPHPLVTEDFRDPIFCNYPLATKDFCDPIFCDYPLATKDFRDPIFRDYP